MNRKALWRFKHGDKAENDPRNVRNKVSVGEVIELANGQFVVFGTDAEVIMANGDLPDLDSACEIFGGCFGRPSKVHR